jgi:hypothetical protein
MVVKLFGMVSAAFPLGNGKASHPNPKRRPALSMVFFDSLILFVKGHDFDLPAAGDFNPLMVFALLVFGRLAVHQTIDDIFRGWFGVIVATYFQTGVNRALFLDFIQKLVRQDFKPAAFWSFKEFRNH